MPIDCSPGAHAELAGAPDDVPETHGRLTRSGGPASRSAVLARTILTERAALGRHMDGDLFSDPALDILLFLFAEGDEGGDVTTTSVCNAARVPRTTALRWIKLLGDRDLIVVNDDARDRRMTLLRLSPVARCNMASWLTDVSRLRANTVDPIWTDM